MVTSCKKSVVTEHGLNLQGFLNKEKSVSARFENSFKDSQYGTF